MMEYLDRLPLIFVILACLTLGLAPFTPEPHIWKKLNMLAAGSLSKPVDIFDFFFYAWPWLLLLAKLAHMAAVK
ncbi:RND transporter [Hyphomonas sp.]|uniref:RND transporter n=1 Tax=Hyphomonas sp. TaxID=87 RepID=UPI003564A5F0